MRNEFLSIECFDSLLSNLILLSHIYNYYQIYTMTLYKFVSIIMKKLPRMTDKRVILHKREISDGLKIMVFLLNAL